MSNLVTKLVVSCAFIAQFVLLLSNFDWCQYDAFGLIYLIQCCQYLNTTHGINLNGMMFYLEN